MCECTSREEAFQDTVTQLERAILHRRSAQHSSGARAGNRRSLRNPSDCTSRETQIADSTNTAGPQYVEAIASATELADGKSDFRTLPQCIHLTP